MSQMEGSNDPPPEAARNLLEPLVADGGSQLLEHLAELSGIHVGPLSVTVESDACPTDTPAELCPAVAALLDGWVHAQGHIEHALAGLSSDQRIRGLDVLASGGSGWGLSSLPGANAIDQSHLLLAQMALLRGAEEAQAELASRDIDALASQPSDCAQGDIIYELKHAPPTWSFWDQPWAPGDCWLVIGASGPNTYEQNVTLLVDLGGKDTYRNNAGAWTPPVPRCDATFTGAYHGASLALDLGAQDDLYNATLGYADGSQGVGLFGAGLLVDQGGNDIYITRADENACWPFVLGQGVGVYGTGALLDRGDGDDSYSAQGYGQAQSSSGIGLLSDEGGADIYRQLSSRYFVQGSSCGGIALLQDLGRDQDRFQANATFSQGAGCLGGLGILLNEAGSDTYWTGRQGIGGLGGIGILYDLAGDDEYGTPPGEAPLSSAQGIGGLGGLGMLLDTAGNDTYTAQHRAQGYGHAGTGILYDAEGDDTYTAETLCQGMAGDRSQLDLGGVGVLLDGGGTDSYTCGTPPETGARGDGEVWRTVPAWRFTCLGDGSCYGPPTGVGVGVDVS